LAEAIRNTTKDFLQSYVQASATKDMTRLSAQLTPDCARHLGPPYYLVGLGAPPTFTMTNAEYESEFGTMEFYTFDSHDLFDLVVDTEKRRSAVRSELNGTFFDGNSLSRSFVWFLDFNEDGTKITQVYQYND
ncbi:hypothetical protein GQ53DRAFT_599191, partial [Thozetella sp. PMI_491]